MIPTPSTQSPVMAVRRLGRGQHQNPPWPGSTPHFPQHPKFRVTSVRQCRCFPCRGSDTPGSWQLVLRQCFIPGVGVYPPTSDPAIPGHNRRSHVGGMSEADTPETAPSDAPQPVAAPTHRPRQRAHRSLAKERPNITLTLCKGQVRSERRCGWLCDPRQGSDGFHRWRRKVAGGSRSVKRAGHRVLEHCRAWNGTALWRLWRRVDLHRRRRSIGRAPAINNPSVVGSGTANSSVKLSR